MRPQTSVIALLIALAATVQTPVISADSGGVDPRALAKAQHMLRQVSAERDALQSEIEKQKAELAKLNRKLTGVQANVDKSRESNATLSEKLQETTRTLLQTQDEKRLVEEANLQQAKQIDLCVDKNAKLIEANRELLKHYEEKGVFSALFQAEPVTGIKQVEIENIVEEYADKIEALKVKPKNAAATASADHE